jgi:hypothetical protein
VAISGDTSGAVTLTVPATAGTRTVTFPAATGTAMVSGNMPAFFYTHNTGGDQTVSASTWTKALFETQIFDTNSSVSSSRFTPTVAGYYQISGSLYAGSGSLQLRVYKNGSAYANIGTNASQNITLGTTLVYCNGSTDYIEIYGYTSTTSFYTDGINMYFAGAMIRAA